MTPRPALTASADHADVFKAIGLMVLATICFALLDTTVKYLVDDHGVPTSQATFLRFAGHVVFSAVVLWPFALRPSLRSAKPLIQLIRSVFMIMTTALNFVALKYLQLDQTVTIFFLTPLLVALLAGPLLGEWVGWHRMLAILAGFVGVLVVMHPGLGHMHWAMLLVLGATCGYALYNVATRYLAPYIYLGLIWMSVGGFLVFGDLPTPWTLGGGAIVILAGLYLFARERRAAAKGGPASQVDPQ